MATLHMHLNCPVTKSILSPSNSTFAKAQHKNTTIEPCTQDQRTAEAGQTPASRGRSEGPEEACNAPRQVRGALDPHVREGLALHPPVRQEGEGHRQAAAAQPPLVPAKMARGVGHDFQAAVGGAVLRGNAAQAACQICGSGGEEGGRIRPRARPLEHQASLGTEPQATDRPPSQAACHDPCLVKAGFRVAASYRRFGALVAAAAPATALGLAATSASWHSTCKDTLSGPQRTRLFSRGTRGLTATPPPPSRLNGRADKARNESYRHPGGTAYVAGFPKLSPQPWPAIPRARSLPWTLDRQA